MKKKDIRKLFDMALEAIDPNVVLEPGHSKCRDLTPEKKKELFDWVLKLKDELNGTTKIKETKKTQECYCPSPRNTYKPINFWSWD